MELAVSKETLKKLLDEFEFSNLFLEGKDLKMALGYDLPVGGHVENIKIVFQQPIDVADLYPMLKLELRSKY